MHFYESWMVQQKFPRSNKRSPGARSTKDTGLIPFPWNLGWRLTFGLLFHCFMDQNRPLLFSWLHKGLNLTPIIGVYKWAGTHFECQIPSVCLNLQRSGREAQLGKVPPARQPVESEGFCWDPQKMIKTPGHLWHGENPCQTQVSRSGPIFRASTVSFKPPVGATIGKVPKRMASICTKPQGSHLLKLRKSQGSNRPQAESSPKVLVDLYKATLRSINWGVLLQVKSDVMKKFLMTPARLTWNRWRNRCHMEPHLLTINDALDVLCCFFTFFSMCLIMDYYTVPVCHL